MGLVCQSLCPVRWKEKKAKTKLKKVDSVQTSVKKREKDPSLQETDRNPSSCKRTNIGSVKASGKKGEGDTNLRKTETEVPGLDKQEAIRNHTRSDYFREALAGLQSSETFVELQRKCKALIIDKRFSDFKIKIDNNINIIDNKLVADRKALDMLPKEKLPEEFRNRLPVTITGDGNSLRRSISVACFGHEDFHEEIRVRIVVEMCTNVETYTDNNYLKKGAEYPEKEAASLVQTFAMFSEQYIPGDRLTKTVIQRIFEAEALKVIKGQEFMGIWQLFYAASVLGSDVLSIYPNLGDRLPKLLLNRTILPRKYKTYQSELVIMWTSNREDLQERNWIPNHLVPILPQCADFGLTLAFEEEDNVRDSNDVSLNDSLVQHFLKQLYNVDIEATASKQTNFTASAPMDLAASTWTASVDTYHTSSDQLGSCPSGEKDLQYNENSVWPYLITSELSGLVASEETGPSSSHQTSLAASEHKSLSASDQTCLSASDQTGLAAGNQTDLTACDQTGLAASDQTGIAASDQTDLTASTRTASMESNLTLSAKRVHSRSTTGRMSDSTKGINKQICTANMTFYIPLSWMMLLGRRMPQILL